MTHDLSDREKASQWAKDLLQRDDWCIIDTETTGLGNEAQICELAVTDCKGNPLLNTRINPTVPIEEVAAKIHGITDEMVQTAPLFLECLVPLLKAVGRGDVVIYNAEFDLRLIRQSLRTCGLQIAFPTSDRRQCRIFTNGGSIHCAMLWYSQWVGEWNDYHGNYRWQRLPGGDHSALGDCRATLDVIKRMAEG